MPDWQHRGKNRAAARHLTSRRPFQPLTQEDFRHQEQSSKQTRRGKGRVSLVDDLHPNGAGHREGGKNFQWGLSLSALLASACFRLGEQSKLICLPVHKSAGCQSRIKLDIFLHLPHFSLRTGRDEYLEAFGYRRTSHLSLLVLRHLLNHTI